MICRPPPSGIHNTGGSPQPSEAEAAMAIGGALPEKNALLEKNGATGQKDGVSPEIKVILTGKRCGWKSKDVLQD